ncbi:MAG: hypothetical protein ACOYNO_08520 [Saprospiraceae bacterium]
MTSRILFGVMFAMCAVWAQAQTATPVFELRNGQFFDGVGFKEGVWYTANGVISSKAPAAIDSVIDLQGAFVIPAMADALCLNIADNNLAPNSINLYADEGVFYLLIAGNTQEGKADAENLLDGPRKPDAAYANGSLTCRGCYPTLDYESRAAKILIPTQIEQRKEELLTARTMHGNGYWTFNSKDEVKVNWPKLMAQKPEALFLQLRKTGVNNPQALNPEVAKAIQKYGKKAKIPVYAYVETVADVRLAMQLKLNGIYGLPGSGWDGSGNSEALTLSDADLVALAKKQMVVVPLFGQAQGITMINKSAVTAFHTKTLQRLYEKGVNVCIGSGDTQRTLRNELNYWFQLGNIDNMALLRTLCVNTPKAVFPKRKIGKIADGYEANLIVLKDNPANNILKTRMVAFKMKAGRVF